MDYFKQFLNSLPQPLNPEEQEQLLIKYFETKDEDIREKLLVHNLRLCAQCAVNYCKKFNKYDIEDQIFSVCYEQLASSLDKFDPNKEASFAHFALKNMNFKLIRYAQDEEYYYSHLAETMSIPDNSNSEECDIFYFIDDGNCVQDEVQADFFRDDIIKFIDGLKDAEYKKEMIKMYLGLGYPRNYSKAEIARHFNCPRESASVVVSKFLILLQKFIAKKYKNVWPDYADKLNKNTPKFKDISERDQYILNAYYNGNSSKSIGEIAKELHLSKGGVFEVLKKQKNSIEQTSLQHVTRYGNSVYKDLAESIFNDRFGINLSKPLSRQELIKKYNLPSSDKAYYSTLKKAERVLIMEGKYTSDEILNIKQAFDEKMKQARIERCKMIYLSACGEEGYERKNLVQLARENGVSISTIQSQIKFYKNYLESLSKSEEQSESEE